MFFSAHLSVVVIVFVRIKRHMILSKYRPLFRGSSCPQKCTLHIVLCIFVRTHSRIAKVKVASSTKTFFGRRRLLFFRFFIFRCDLCCRFLYQNRKFEFKLEPTTNLLACCIRNNNFRSTFLTSSMPLSSSSVSSSSSSLSSCFFELLVFTEEANNKILTCCH